MRTFIPTPANSAFGIGPLTIHYYALCIILGIFVALTLGKKRSGENSEILIDIAVYAIPAGVIGGRAYHVITTPEKYFNSNFFQAFKIWEGGMGIWGAIFCGAAVSLWRLKQLGKTNLFYPLADSLAPGIIFAQAIGRIGNWFNGELFGKPSKLPWALQIPVEKRPTGFENFATFTPTFLYEALWCVFVGVLLLKIKNYGDGKVFWSYVALYSIGRLVIETFRIDYSHLVFGLRLNVWVALLFFGLASIKYLKIMRGDIR